jgi:hypothetical protein
MDIDQLQNVAISWFWHNYIDLIKESRFTDLVRFYYGGF